jgi:major membrane immunogen (membrane-anchored lipoprotein)
MRKITRACIACGTVPAAFAATALLVLSAGILVSCSSAEYLLKDGYYSAEAAEFDSHGWKEYVTICVSSGQIIMVEYNAFNTSGFIKSWDMDYMRVMNAEDGTYPNAYTRYYGGKFMKNQGVDDIDLLSGSTHSHYSFLQLAEAVLENARLGETATRLVVLDEIETD